MTADGHSPVNPWLRLFRLPNLLTVPGDPLAGFFIVLAGHGQLLPLLAAVAASLCLYMFGLAVNDIVDIETDRVERPDRPLPSGQLTVTQARGAAIAAAFTGLNIALLAGVSALCVAGALAFLILAYNAVLKRIPLVGTFAMGACRGLSVLLGVVAARPDWDVGAGAVLAIVGVTAYVWAFSALAKNEMAPEKPMGPLRWVPLAVLFVMLPATLSVVHGAGRIEGMAPTVFVFLMCMAILRAWLLGGMFYRLQPVPDTIAGHIRNLLQVQACLCIIAGDAGLPPAFFLMVLWWVFPRLARRFYSS